MLYIGLGILLYTGRVDSVLRECFEMLYTVKYDQKELSVDEGHEEKCDIS